MASAQRNAAHPKVRVNKRLSAVETALAAMQVSFPDVRSGDRLTGLHNPSRGADFWLNGQARPGVADPEFSRLFFGIWLSQSTSEPEMRRALLPRPPA